MNDCSAEELSFSEHVADVSEAATGGGVVATEREILVLNWLCQTFVILTVTATHTKNNLHCSKKITKAVLN